MCFLSVMIIVNMQCILSLLNSSMNHLDVFDLSASDDCRFQALTASSYHTHPLHTQPIVPVNESKFPERKKPKKQASVRSTRSEDQEDEEPEGEPERELTRSESRGKD